MKGKMVPWTQPDGRTVHVYAVTDWLKSTYKYGDEPKEAGVSEKYDGNEHDWVLHTDEVYRCAACRRTTLTVAAHRLLGVRTAVAEFERSGDISHAAAAALRAALEDVPACDPAYVPPFVRELGRESRAAAEEYRERMAATVPQNESDPAETGPQRPEGAS